MKSSRWLQSYNKQVQRGRRIRFGCYIVLLCCFLLVLGTVGALECCSISVVQFCIQLAAFLVGISITLNICRKVVHVDD